MEVGRKRTTDGDESLPSSLDLPRSSLMRRGGGGTGDERRRRPKFPFLLRLLLAQDESSQGLCGSSEEEGSETKHWHIAAALISYLVLPNPFFFFRQSLVFRDDDWALLLTDEKERPLLF